MKYGEARMSEVPGGGWMVTVGAWDDKMYYREFLHKVSAEATFRVVKSGIDSISHNELINDFGFKLTPKSMIANQKI